MALYSLNDKGQLQECKWNCKINHQHISGSFETALKYFMVNPNEIKSSGDVWNILYYYQTDMNTTRRLSNELFDLMVQAQSKEKYFAPVMMREEIAIAALNKGYDFNLIMDEPIIERLKKSERRNDQSRVYMYEQWRKNEFYKDLGLKY